MLTLEQVETAIRQGRQSECLDGRDYGTLTRYFPVEKWPVLGFELKDGATPPDAPEPWTRKAIIKELQDDNDFGFTKALNQRGISAGLQYESVKLWLWILEDDLQHFDKYAQYGLPLFKAVAVKYGFKNPIGADAGNEDKYAAD